MCRSVPENSSVPVSQDMKRLPEAVELIEKASVMYVENGTSGTAGIALDRAGKYVTYTVFIFLGYYIIISGPGANCGPQPGVKNQ